MGLLTQNEQQYYDSGNSGNYGNYQFVSLRDIITGFMVQYVGESKLLTKVNRNDVQYHAMRAIQEFSYDTFKSFKAQEITVPNTLKMILPQDYVNYTKLTRVGDDGIERTLYPTGKTSNPTSIKQDADGVYQIAGNDLDLNDESTAWSRFKSTDFAAATADDFETDELFYDASGRRYGLDPQHAQNNGSFYIDQSTGYVHFGSNLAGVKIVLHYISDGLGTDSEMVVHKFAEEAVYKWIAYGIISARSNMPEYVVQRFKKERFAAARKAKIRLSNIKIEEFAQVLKGQSKPIK